MPFERVPAHLAFFCRSTLSVETARRVTEGAGAVLERAQDAEVARLEREQPEPPPGPTIQAFSADGAMVPLRGGEWIEVKTLALGTVGQRVTREGKAVPQISELVYFSRHAPAAEFGRLATGTTHQAGTPCAGTVVAVVDGADWLQGLIDVQCPDAVRILDFPHAAEHVSAAAHAVLGQGSPAATAWLDQQLTALKSGDPDEVLAALATLATHPAASEEAQTTCAAVIAYLTKRREQIAYAAFRAAGYPIGDGSVESANKLVVEARLKGSGMRWERENVNPMVALRACACNDQWASGWTTITAGLRRQEVERRARRRREKHEERARAQECIPEALAPPSPPPPPAHPPREKQVINGTPTVNHVWRQFRLPGSRHFPSRAKP
jgi:hypothetical protein